MAGIYVHIPFCHAKCAYCDFYSVARTSAVADFTRVLSGEYIRRRSELGDEQIRTIYFGGGTPSILPLRDLREIVALLPKEHVEEFTLEANPEDIEPEKVRAWVDLGINRVSIGVQSLVDEELATVRRRHSAADALQAIDTLQKCGVERISGDLIYGLPGQTSDSFMFSLKRLLASGITHLSAYSLSYEPGTLLTRMLKEGRVSACCEEELVEMYRILCDESRSNGFEHYEISNFAVPGYHSRHNSAYWDFTPYLGLGPSAHSLGADGVRRVNNSSLREYLAGAVPEVDDESELDRINDRIITALRTSKGLNLGNVPEACRDNLMKNARKHLLSGALVAEHGRLMIPEEKWLVSNDILSDLLLDE